MVALLSEVDELSSRLSRATLHAASERLARLAAARSAVNVAPDDGSPLQPETLTYANQDNVLVLGGGGDDAGSVASLDGGGSDDDFVDVELGEARGQQEDSTPRQGEDP
eukprot:2279889-Prymnesium_polylepis.1